MDRIAVPARYPFTKFSGSGSAQGQRQKTAAGDRDSVQSSVAAIRSPISGAAGAEAPAYKSLPHLPSS